jgi:Domain of unknown function (DUF1992)
MNYYESSIDRAIREAQERGEFDNLPGAGKPLKNSSQGYIEDWWIHELAQREDLSGALPPAMRLRREVEDLPEILAKKPSEQSVRAYVEDLNARIEKGRREQVEGPPVTVTPVDVEHFVRNWRELKGLK